VRVFPKISIDLLAGRIYFSKGRCCLRQTRTAQLGTGMPGIPGVPLCYLLFCAQAFEPLKIPGETGFRLGVWLFGATRKIVSSAKDGADHF